MRNWGCFSRVSFQTSRSSNSAILMVVIGRVQIFAAWRISETYVPSLFSLLVRRWPTNVESHFPRIFAFLIFDSLGCTGGSRATYYLRSSHPIISPSLYEILTGLGSVWIPLRPYVEQRSPQRWLPYAWNGLMMPQTGFLSVASSSY
jgi:hypothetical protein